MATQVLPVRSANRRCEQCGGAMPHRMSRQRNSKGKLICDSCKEQHMPSWSTAHSSLNLMQQAEMRRRESEAIISISQVARMQREGHDSGDQAVINHCPFCGSGAVVGGSDGSVTCDFCHTPFTVQVQPTHPNMPQTIDGQPTVPPGMPGGQESEMSAPSDPAVEEDEEGVAEDPLGDADPNPPSDQPARPGAPAPQQPKPPPPAAPEGAPEEDEDGKPNPFAKGKDKADSKGDGKFPPKGKDSDDKDDKDGDGKKKSLPPWMKKKTLRTSTGAALPAEEYLAHLALTYTDDRPVTLDAVRVAHMQREARMIPCPDCAVTVGHDENDFPVMGKGPGCRYCGGRGERDSEEIVWDPQRYLNPTVQDLLDSKHATRMVTCPTCNGDGRTGPDGHETPCPRCGGDGELDADAPHNFDLREEPGHQGHEGRWKPFGFAEDYGMFGPTQDWTFKPGDRVVLHTDKPFNSGWGDTPQAGTITGVLPNGDYLATTDLGGEITYRFEKENVTPLDDDAVYEGRPSTAGVVPPFSP